MVRGISSLCCSGCGDHRSVSMETESKQLVLSVLRRTYCIMNRVVYIILLTCLVYVPVGYFIGWTTALPLIAPYVLKMETYEVNETTITKDLWATFVRVGETYCFNNNTGNVTCTEKETMIETKWQAAVIFLNCLDYASFFLINLIAWVLVKWRNKQTKYYKRRIFVVVNCFCYITMWLHMCGYVVFVEIVGAKFGFTWADLNFLAIIQIGFELEFRILIPLIIIWMKTKSKIYRLCPPIETVVDALNNYKCIRNHICEKGKNSNDFISTNYVTTENLQVRSPRSMTVTSPDEDRYKKDITTLLEKTWLSDEGLYLFQNVEIKGIRRINSGVTNNSKIIKFAKTVGGVLRPPEQYREGIKPVATAAIVPSLPSLMGKCDSNINEYYLFYGLSSAEFNDVNENGLRPGFMQTGILGRGLHFTDNPAFVHRFVDATGMKWKFLVVRVTLGNFVIQTKVDRTEGVPNSAPCKKCFKCAYTKDRRRKPPSDMFDSVIYDGTERYYVVYNGARAKPEFVVEMQS